MLKKKVRLLDLKSRTLKILISIVERYIQTGRPVGSKAIYELLEDSPSPSTIRNEMASLTAMGFLEQPHVSSGRVPSVNGYKVYINNIPYGDISETEKNYIYGMFSGSSFDPESVLREASEVLSKITNCTIVFAAPPVGDSLVREVKFIKIGKRTPMLILITSSGMVQNQIFNCDFDINDDILHMFEKSVNEEFRNRKIKDLLLDANKIIFNKDSKDIIITSAFKASFSAVKKICQNRVGVEGKKRLFQFQEVPRAFEILNFVEEEDFSKFIFSSSSKIKVYLGNDSKIDIFSECSVVVEKYRVSELNEGAIIVVGPVRMNYPDVISKLDYIVRIIEGIFSAFLNL